jgi:hypothetical protein
MTIAELTGQIDERIRSARDEIQRLQAARDALADRPEPVTTAASTRARDARRAVVSDRTPRRQRRSRSPKPTVVLALGRELDAGLRARV